MRILGIAIIASFAATLSGYPEGRGPCADAPDAIPFDPKSNPTRAERRS